jgi:hypothetical protein
MGNVSRITRAGADEPIVTALQQGLLGFDQLPLGGKMYTQAEAAAFILSRSQAAHAILQAKAAWLEAIATFEKLDKEADIAVRDLRNLVIGACGEESPVVKKFGFAPRKKPVQTPEQKEAANQKRAATRKKRNTMGRKQRLKVKGEVPAATPAPEPTPAGTAAPAVVLAVVGAMGPVAMTTTNETTGTMTAGVTADGAGTAGAGSTGAGRGESSG